MKWIKFTRVVDKKNVGTEESPVWEEVLTPLALSYCEYNLEIAKKEAYNGEYIIEDDRQPDPEPIPETEPLGTDELWNELAMALQEGVDSV